MWLRVSEPGFSKLHVTGPGQGSDLIRTTTRAGGSDERGAAIGNGAWPATSRCLNLSTVSRRPCGPAPALPTQPAVLPRMELHVSLGDNLVIGAIFTAVSIAGIFKLRRLLESIRSVHLRAIIRDARQ